MIMQEGLLIERIVFPPTSEGISVIVTGENDVNKITVSMQNGQMAPVPWFEVLYKDGKTQLWNGALVEGITLA